MPSPLPLLLNLALLASPCLAQDQWPAWRGPTGDGISSAKDLPIQWSEEQNIIWKTELPSWSGATPVIWNEHVFLMSPSAVSAADLEQAETPQASRGRGRRGPSRHPGGESLMLMALGAKDGKLLWQRELDEGNRLWMKSNQTSPSPVTDGKLVWATTGTGVISAFDYQGELIWDFALQEKYGKFGQNWGYASSPLLHAGQLILEVLHGSHTEEASYVLALDAASGDVIWRVERPTDAPRESPDAYTTPILLKLSGKEQIVISGGDYVTGHDPKTGKELWRVPGLNPRKASNYRVVPTPILIEDLLIAPTRVKPIIAIALDEDLAPTAEDVAWTYASRGGPDVPSPTSDGRYLFLVDDSAMATCIDPGTGEAIWGPERTAQGKLSGSPVCADGKLYFTTEEGVTVVLRAGPKFELLAKNQLDGGYTLSSPAIAGGRIFVRMEKFLYCIGKP